ncbi:ECF transporter S component [Thermoflexus hugenholtzii]|uniref:ECF-type riboflavin transporter, S component n=1 Tax=Thermoflexus hugenholtzii JAD2 TaxID=877466 RepID=A0A212RT16_9CHLR|nr:ECF transporter S component [Thermoflexus hugenholtzii]SNB75809.1 ECF-type riboflavin transporter, S component [Thermoflexus hugenholtzii JAD2]
MARKALTWLILLIVVVLLMGLASLMTGPEGVRLQGFGWLLWVAIGAVIVYIIYFATADHPAWQIGTREVVYMAIGAALYGVFSYLFNGTVFVVPSVSQVALRPAIVFPVFFGYVFGPAVGFFTGAVGNILGDFLTGWGVFPAWDIGNGLVGLVAGLPVILGRERALNILTGVVAAVGVALSLWAMTTEIESPFFGGPLSPLMRWVPLIGAALVVALRFALGGNIALASVIVWGAVANIVGIGFAAIADIWINGYPPAVALLGEFVPAAGPNILHAAILTPLLVGAYNALQQQLGRGAGVA